MGLLYWLGSKVVPAQAQLLLPHLSLCRLHPPCCLEGPAFLHFGSCSQRRLHRDPLHQGHRARFNPAPDPAQANQASETRSSVLCPVRVTVVLALTCPPASKRSWPPIRHHPAMLWWPRWIPSCRAKEVAGSWGSGDLLPAAKLRQVRCCWAKALTQAL